MFLNSEVFLFLQNDKRNLSFMTPEQQLNEKIFPDFQSFFETLKQWKTRNEKIVFTNGCFDLIHRGHIDSLLQAATFGSRLVVGLNTDSSVRLLKGKSRPLIEEQSRARILASLFFVDAVVLFPEETPYELIGKIHPDVLVKGEEYQLEEIAGHNIVLADGGKVERIKLTEGFSTTSLIEKIKNS